jgi:hypothetical protein
MCTYEIHVLSLFVLRSLLRAFYIKDQDIYTKRILLILHMNVKRAVVREEHILQVFKKKIF